MKSVIKITPVALYDVRGVESWLEDMALRGLVLKRFRPLFSTFQEGPACKIRYRAEPCRQKTYEDLPQEMLDLYQDFGWTLVCAVNDFLIFATQDHDAPEPHSDPGLQSKLWSRLYQRKRRNFAICLLLALAAVVLTFQALFAQGTPILSLINTSILWAFVSPILIFTALPQMWSNVQQLSLILRQLEAGIPLEHRIAYPRRRWCEAVSLLFASVLLVLLLFSQFVLPLSRDSAQPLDALTAFTPLSLAEVEGDGYQSRHFMGGGIDYANFFAVEHHLLCPNRWKVVQSGSITPEQWNRMEIWRYDLPGFLSVLSAPLARELLDSAMGLDQDIWWTGSENAVWTVDYHPCKDVTFLATAHNGEFQIAAAAAGDKAVLVQYTGSGNLQDYLEEIAGMAA